jgi:hypothetical protein
LPVIVAVSSLAALSSVEVVLTLAVLLTWR